MVTVYTGDIGNTFASKGFCNGSHAGQLEFVMGDAHGRRTLTVRDGQHEYVYSKVETAARSIR